MKDLQKFENALISHLNDYKLEEAALKEYSSTIVELRKNDIQIDKIWKYGQPSIDGFFRTDGVDIRSHINTKDIEKLTEIFKIKNLHSIEVFPLGIVDPELLDIRFKIGIDPVI